MARLADTSHLILALTARADVLRARSVAEACSGAFWTERFGERGTRRIEEDAQHHISQLQTALQFNDPLILSQYAVWLQQVLTHRGMCSRHLAEHFEALARAIRHESLPDARTAETYLQAAVDALIYRSEPARAVHDATETVAGSMLGRLERHHTDALDESDHLVSDIGYLLSYLTDAVALDRPDLFGQYVVWIDGYFTRRKRAEGYLSEILRALETSLDELDGTVGDTCRPFLSEARSSLDESTP